MPTPSGNRTAGIIGPLAAIFAVTFLCGTTPDESRLLAERRTRIAGMTHAEVEQLRRNYDEFRKLSLERRKALQELDDEVKQDTANGGHLLKLMTDYNRWLSTLSPFDQERILSKTDPVERAQLVHQIREEQQKSLAATGIDAGGRPALSLEPAEFDTMLKAVEENFLTPETRKKIAEQLTGRERHLRILKAAQQQAHSATASQTLVQTLLDAIPNDSLKARIMKQSPRAPRRLLGQVMSRSLAGEWWDEIRPVLPKATVIDEEINRRLAMASGKRDQQKSQFSSKQGRRMIAVQLALANDDQFKELRPVFMWLSGGLQHRSGRGQSAPGSATTPDESRTDEAEGKAKAGE
jgi:hypothetical protein